MNHSHVLSAIGAFARDEDGSVAVEYGVIAVAMCLAISPAFYFLKDSVADKFVGISEYFTLIQQ